jgi:hypothetical protein
LELPSGSTPNEAIQGVSVHMVPPENAVLPEPYFTPAEIAEHWRLSVDTVIRLFEHEPGVLVLENSRSKQRRRYRTIRIPNSVLVRVQKRRSLVTIDNEVYAARRS